MLQAWYSSQRSDIGVILIPTDSIDMNNIEDTCLDKFKYEVRSLQLSINVDGVNPYSLKNTNYYIWPVVVINKNIPQCLNVKNEHLILALIVLGVSS
jgi:hypothetical protein